MEKRKKWIGIGIIAVGLVAYLIYSSVKPIETELLSVQPQTVSQSFAEEGITVSAMERPVYSKTDGIIEQLFAQEGQVVTKGDVLAEIDTKAVEYQLEQLKAQRNSLLGQEKMTSQEVEQQLGQLKGQLESIRGQEKQAQQNPYEAQVNQQQLAIEEVKRKLALARDDRQKMEQLFENGVVAKKELDSAESLIKELESQQLQQEQALKLIEEQAEPKQGTDQYYYGLKNALQTQIQLLENYEVNGSKQYYQGLIESVGAQIKQLTDVLADGQLQAPMNGIVKEVHAEEGSMSSPQQPIITLTTPESLEIEVYLLTEDILNVTEGMKVSLIQERRTGDYTFGGMVKSIAPVAEERVSALGLNEQRVKVTVLPDEQAPELLPGYAIDVSFTTAEEKDQLAVPKGSLFPLDDGEALFIVKDGKATIQAIETGMETNELVVIEKGLKVGSQIIKNPQQEGLESGTRVKE